MRLRLVHHVPALAHRLDDQPVGDEQIGDADPLVEQAARVAAHVEHQALDAAVFWLLADSCSSSFSSVVVDAGGEHAQLDVGDAVVEQLALDRLQLVLRAPDPERQLAAAPLDDQRDLAAARPLHARHRLVELQRRDLDAVDALDDVARLDARLRGGRALDRRDDHEAVLALLDVDADALDLLVALGLLLQPAVLLRVHEARVRIEHVGQAARGAVHELGLRQILDVVALDVREHLREDAELLVRVEAARGERPREDQTRREGGEHEQNGSTATSWLRHRYTSRPLVSHTADPSLGLEPELSREADRTTAARSAHLPRSSASEERTPRKKIDCSDHT